ncbi:MAG: endospore germination permease [Firmicutes bacterium]|nr:endospore germination permease [Bacillota bacterium]
MFQEKIASRQLFNIFFIMRTTIVISILPVLTVAQARQDAWLVAIITFFTSAVFVYLIGRLALNFPDKNIVQYSRELLGNWPGGLLSLLFLGLFLLMGATDLRIYGEVLRTIFLPETPLVVILGSMVIVAIMVVYAGLEPLGRMTDLIFPVFTLAVLFTLFFPIVETDFGNLLPVLYGGWRPVLFASLTPTAIAVQYANLAILVPSVVEPRETLRAALNSLLWASIILVLAAVIVIAVLGADEGAHAFFPVFKMVRAVRISEFLERFEFFPTFAWGLGLFITLAVNLYSLSKGLSQLCSFKDHRPFLLPLAVILGTLALQGYNDSLEIRNFFQPQIIAPALFFVFLFPVIVLWIAYFLKRRKNSVALPEDERRG